MTKRELLEQLESFSDEAEVRLMSQPNWPFEYSVAGVIGSEVLRAVTPDGDVDFVPAKADSWYDPQEDPDLEVAYIVEGAQLGYGTKAAWEG